MKRPALILLLVFVSILAQFWTHAQVYRMGWIMDKAEYARRGATVSVYCAAPNSSDYSFGVVCAYLAELDGYLWQAKADIPAEYQGQEFILFGSDGGSVLARKFIPADLLAQPVAWTAIPAPSVALAGTTATITWTLPSLETGVLDHWELSVDGADIALPSQPYAAEFLPGSHSVALKAVLIGAPVIHAAYGLEAAVEVTG